MVVAGCGLTTAVANYAVSAAELSCGAAPAEVKHDAAETACAVVAEPNCDYVAAAANYAVSAAELNGDDAAVV